MKNLSLVSLLFFASCSLISTKYPRVVKNGCGTYAVQMSEKGFLGVVQYRPHYECDIQLGGSGWTIIDGSPRDCGWDTTNVELVKSKKYNIIWADIKDTSYEYPLGRELQFKTEAGATAAMNSYLRRTAEYNAFVDSITLCHTYK